MRALVWLTKAEIDVLRQDLPEEDYNYIVDKISAYKALKGRNYTSDFQAIKYWGMDALREHKAKTIRFQYSGTAKTPISRTQMANESHAALLRKFAA